MDLCGFHGSSSKRYDLCHIRVGVLWVNQQCKYAFVQSGHSLERYGLLPKVAECEALTSSSGERSPGGFRTWGLRRMPLWTKVPACLGLLEFVTGQTVS